MLNNTQISVLPYSPNSVFIITVDFGDIPAGKYKEKLQEFEEAHKEDIENLKSCGRSVIIIQKNVNISSMLINDADVIVCNIDLGTMPPNKGKEYINSIREGMKTILPDNKVFVLGNRNDRKAFEMSIQREE